MLGDLLDVGDQVNKLGIRVVVDTSRESQGLSNFNADLKWKFKVQLQVQIVY